MTLSSFKRGLSALLATVLAFQAPALAISASAQAEMISTESFIASSSSAPERAKVLALLERADVRQQLQAHGVSAEEAAARVNALSASELQELNSRIDQLPAGADAVGSILGTALALFVILLITDILCLTKVFPFTRCAGR